MNAHVRLFCSIGCAAFLLSSGLAMAQAGKKSSGDIIKSLKPGQWVQLDGAIQKDLTILTKKVKFITGDFQDDDWEIKAPLRRIVDPSKRQFEVLRLAVAMAEGADYENDAGTLKSFGDLKVGMLVELEGTFLKDGSFLAEEVQQELDFEPQEINEIKAVGKVERVNPANSTVVLMGITFQISPSTTSKSVIK